MNGKPDLKRLYSFNQSTLQPPVVIIHGAFGSKLSDDQGNEVWPGSISKLLFGKYLDLAQKIIPGTLKPKSKYSPYAVVDEVSGIDFYGKIIETLRDTGGYKQSSPGEPNPELEKRYYIFTYDWRQSIAENAVKLDEFIDKIRDDYVLPKGNKVPVDIVAHSMGGLLTRYFVRYGRQGLPADDLSEKAVVPPTFAGAEKLRRVILLGTPNMGSVKGLRYFIGGAKIGVNTIPPEALLTMPGAYGLLPHPKRRWLINRNGKKLRGRLYTVNFWRTHQWSIFDPEVRDRIASRFKSPEEGEKQLRVLEQFFEKQLKRGQQFHYAISHQPKHDQSGKPRPKVQYIVFGGDCTPTTARGVIEEDKGKDIIRWQPDEIKHPKPGVNYERLMLEPGDGSVTKPSLLGTLTLNPGAVSQSVIPIAYSLFLCEEHDALTGNISFQDNLLNTLLRSDQILSMDHSE